MLRPATKSVDASVLLARTITPEPMRPGWKLAMSGIDFVVNGGTAGEWREFMIDPPPGTSFDAGYYPKVQRPEFRTAGHAGLDISADSRA